MIVGPVLPVELVTVSRRLRYFLVRTAYAIVLLVALWLTGRDFGGMTSQQQLAQLATQFFGVLATLQITFVLALTPPIVAGTIAEEKERKTLDYLLTTDLRDHEIVLGKLTGRLLQLLVLVSVAFPVISFTMLLGGVSLDGLVAVSVATLSTLMVAAAVSMVTSVFSRRAREAVSRSLVLLLALVAVPPILRWVPAGIFGFRWLPVIDRIVEAMLAGNPFMFLSRVFNPPGPSWSLVGELVFWQVALAVPCTLVAIWQVRRAYLRQTYGRTRRRSGATWRLWRPELAESPMIWKELFAERPRGGSLSSLMQLLLLAAVVVPTVWIFADVMNWIPSWGIDWDDAAFNIYITVIGTAVACLGLLAIAVHGATSVTAERERQTWDVLLSTPLPAGEIVLGKFLGCLYAGRSPTLALAVLWVLGIAAGSVSPPCVLAMAVSVVVIAGAAGFAGLTFSLKCKGSVAAMTAALGTCVFVGGGYLFCCIPLVQSTGSDELILAGCVPFLLGFPATVGGPDSNLGSNTGELAVTCMLGVTMYLLIALLLMVIAVNAFDDWTARGARPRPWQNERPWQDEPRKLSRTAT